MKKLTERDLNYVIDNGIIDTADVLNQIENMKREQILKEYGDRIRKTKGGYYFRIQDNTLKNGEYRRRSKDKHVLEDLLVQYCKSKENKNLKQRKMNHLNSFSLNIWNTKKQRLRMIQLGA